MTPPLRVLLGKDLTWAWKDRQEKSLKILRQDPMKAQILAHFKQGKPVSLSADGCHLGVAAVVLHERYPEANWSRSLTDAQRKYAKFRKETLATVKGSRIFYEHFTA